jgi:hypothetical protein
MVGWVIGREAGEQIQVKLMQRGESAVSIHGKATVLYLSKLINSDQQVYVPCSSGSTSEPTVGPSGEVSYRLQQE